MKLIDKSDARFRQVYKYTNSRFHNASITYAYMNPSQRALGSWRICMVRSSWPFLLLAAAKNTFQHTALVVNGCIAMLKAGFSTFEQRLICVVFSGRLRVYEAGCRISAPRMVAYVRLVGRVFKSCASLRINVTSATL